MKKTTTQLLCRDDREREALLARLRRSGTPVYALLQPREGKSVLRLPREALPPRDRGGTVTF